MVCNFYLSVATVYVPTVARTEAGFYVEVEPVSVVSAREVGALQNAVIEYIHRGNPTTPTRKAFPKPVLLKYGNIKSWSAFEKSASLWTLEEKGGVYQIKPGRPCIDGGWEESHERVESFAPGATVEAVAQRIASLLQTAAA
jgi:hypothetical protein